MATITHIFSTLVPPRVQGAEPDVRGAQITLEGKLYGMLARVYDKADEECNIPIRFRASADGTQFNEVRSALIDMVETPDLGKSIQLGQRLGAVTTGRSGLGLLFVVLGESDGVKKLLVSRFPANPGILAEASAQGLSVELVEKVFMKNVAAYKAALYRSQTPTAEFWHGMMIDKQLAQMGESAATYWLTDFLLSDLLTTSKAGSRRLATALKKATRLVQSVEDKHQLVSVITLASGFTGQTITPRQVLQQFALPDRLQQVVLAQLPTTDSADAAFVLDSEEFATIAAVRTVKLDSGALLTAATEDFDTVFESEIIDESDALVRYSTVGHIVDERVKGREQ